MIRYCRVLEVAAYSGPPELTRVLAGLVAPPELVYVWDDHTVTDVPLPEAEPIFVSDNDDWREYCARTLAAEPAA
jgi:hypothetical protein